MKRLIRKAGDIVYGYHITHVSNLFSIFKTGALLPANDLIDRDIDYYGISYGTYISHSDCIYFTTDDASTEASSYDIAKNLDFYATIKVALDKSKYQFITNEDEEDELPLEYVVDEMIRNNLINEEEKQIILQNVNPNDFNFSNIEDIFNEYLNRNLSEEEYEKFYNNLAWDGNQTSFAVRGKIPLSDFEEVTVGDPPTKLNEYTSQAIKDTIIKSYSNELNEQLINEFNEMYE